jgi:general stress protein YciG
MTKPKPNAKRGFAAMSAEKRTEISRRGGAAVPNDKRSFSQDRELASSAGRKGGQISHADGHRGAAK